MLSAAEMEWVRPKSDGTPTPRSGHSLTVTSGGIAYMFGGVTKAARGPCNELYKVETTKDSAKWTKIDGGKMKPLPRWHHTATSDGRGNILVYGGYSADFR